jgi:hypothetical protein
LSIAGDASNKVTGISEGHTRKEVFMKKNKLLLLFISMFFVLLIGQNVRADTRKLIIIGDSRTEDMHLTVGNSGCVSSYEVGQGIIWKKKTGIPAI